MKKLLITDLDNTLYDWVSYYALSFDAMLNELVLITSIEKSLLLQEFKLIHQRHGNIEHPFAALELPSLIKYFNTNNKDHLRERLDPAFHAFNSMRKKTLYCYPLVEDTLKKLHQQGVKIVAHTEAPIRNAVYRLEKLDLKKYTNHLYAPADRFIDELDPSSKKWIDSYGDYVVLLKENEKKPNPELLLDICKKENISPSDAIYVGDSLIKDITMANDAGITSVWSRYGKQHNKTYWEILVSITHWTKEDVIREENLKNASLEVKASYSIDSFEEVERFFACDSLS